MAPYFVFDAKSWDNMGLHSVASTMRRVEASAGLPDWTRRDVDEFVRSDPVHGPQVGAGGTHIGGEGGDPATQRVRARGESIRGEKGEGPPSPLCACLRHAPPSSGPLRPGPPPRRHHGWRGTSRACPWPPSSPYSGNADLA